MEEQVRIRGRVDQFTTSRGKVGFGFINSIDLPKRERFFFHSSRVERKQLLQKDSLVEFDVQPAPAPGKLRLAVNVRLVSVPECSSV